MDRPVWLARIFLITVQLGGHRGVTPTRQGALPRPRRDPSRRTSVRPTRCDRGGRPEEQSTGFGCSGPDSYGQLGVEVSDADAPPAHRGLLDMRLVGYGARALATAVLRLLPAGAALTLEVLACGGRSRWHRGRLTGAMMTALDPFYLEHHRCDLKSEPRTIASG